MATFGPYPSPTYPYPGPLPYQPPGWQPPQTYEPVPTPGVITTTNTIKVFRPRTLSDEDVERIARRVVEILREAK